jgi:hypothetical protein
MEKSSVTIPDDVLEEARATSEKALADRFCLLDDNDFI